MAIKWKEGELDDLRREIARYNRKIARLRKAGTDLGMGELPQRMGERTIKKIESRRELNIIKKSIERFVAKGSEALTRTRQGLVIPKYERQEINALNARINARRRKAAKEAAAARGKGDLPLMGRILDNEARERRAITKVKPKDYAEYKRVAKNESAPDYVRRRDKEYHANYEKMIDRLFSPRDARKIKKALRKVPDRKFVTETIKEEAISFSIGSPPGMDRDTVSANFYEQFKRSFPAEFKDVELKDLDSPLEEDFEEYEF